MGEKIQNSIGPQISQSASREKRAQAEVGTILGPMNSPLHQDRVRLQRQERQFTTICSRDWFTIPSAGSSIPQPPGWGKAPRRQESRPEHRERPDRTRRGAPRGATRHAREARHRPQPRHTDRCQATTAAGCREPGERAQHATNHGKGTGAKQHQPPSGWTSARPEGSQPLPATEQPPCGWTSARPEGTQPLPATNSRRPDGRVRARSVPSPCRLRTAAVRMHE